MLNLDQSAVATWAAQPWTIKRSNPFSDGVEELEMLLTHFGLQPGPVNQVFDGATEGALLEYQRMRLLDVDGKAGEKTRADMLRAWEAGWEVGLPFRYPTNESALVIYGGVHPDVGPLPSAGGKISWFGGPDDEGDRGYGQALVAVSPPTVEQLYKKHSALVDLGLFRDGLSDPLPMTTCCGKPMRAGISWCLDPMSYYLAMRWAGGSGRPNPYTHRVVIMRGDKAVVVAPTDWGPAAWTGKDADLSLGALQAIGASTGHVARFAWAVDDAELGPRVL